jgi:hypothetical protein
MMDVHHRGRVFTHAGSFPTRITDANLERCLAADGKQCCICCKEHRSTYKVFCGHCCQWTCFSCVQRLADERCQYCRSHGMRL